MTHSIDAPFPPPPTSTTTTTTTDYSGSTSTTGSQATSTSDVAKDEARNVGQTATQAGSQVASTAADQAKGVVQETQQQARNLLDEGRSQVREQAVTQQQKAAQGLSSVAQELRGLLNGDGTSTSGPAHDLLHQATGKIDELASWLQNREPADLLDEVRSFARRKPGTFLLGAALAGVVAGRLTSGVKAAHTGSSGGQHRTGDTGYLSENYVDPAPAYTGYADTGYTTTPGYTESTVGGVGGTGAGTGAGAPLPPPPYGTTPPPGSVVPPTTPAGWDDPNRSTGGV
jgi:hypothetical protein